MKVVYIVQNIFTSRDYYRYGFNELINHSKLEVEIWDISKILYPNIKLNYPKFKNIIINKKCIIIDFKTTIEVISHLHKTQIFYCMVLIEFNFKSLPIFKVFSENKIKYAGTGIGMINIQPDFNYSLINTKSIFKKIFNVTLRRILSKMKRKCLIFLIKFHKIDFYNCFFLSGGIKTSVDNILVSNNTNLVRLHSNNFDLHLKKSISYKNEIEYSYDVYIDQNVTSSADSAQRNDKFDIPSEKYYKELNIFFKKLEEISGRKIIVSAHPKTNLNELKSYMPNRKIINNSDSSNLIYYSNTVIVSYSMAIGFACLYDKNIILITNDSINNYKKPILNGIRDYMKINYINISKNYNLKNDLNFNKSRYSNYIKDFLTPSTKEESLFSVKIYNHFKKVNILK